MRLFILTIVTMIAFAANSVLNRWAVVEFGTDPGVYAVVRTVAGALMLAGVLALRGSVPPPGPLLHRFPGAVSLALYMIGFSLAYLSLDAGIGALILFGGVQATMFTGALLGAETIPLRRWIGATISLLGLAILVWPGDAAAPPLAGAGFMALAALGWGIYSLIGRKTADPLAETARNFLWAVPLVLPLLLTGTGGSLAGIGLAVLGGAVTSGLGYALWYAVLPQLGATRAAVAQLSVPAIATLGGVVLLSEAVSLRLVLATVLVLGGIGVSLLRRRS